MEKKYSDEAIEVIDGLESVRRRAPMYVGRLDADELRRSSRRELRNRL